MTPTDAIGPVSGRRLAGSFPPRRIRVRPRRRDVPSPPAPRRPARSRWAMPPAARSGAEPKTDEVPASRPVLGTRRRHWAVRWPELILVTALVVGAVLRFWHLGTNPPGVNQDEAVTGYDALSIWLTGRDHHGAPFPFWVLETFGDWSSPLLTFLMAPFVGVFGLEITVVRSVTALLGLAMVAGTFGVARELTRNPWVASLAAAFAAVSPWAVHYSRYALLPITAMAFLMLSVWCLLRALRTGSGPGLVAAATLIGASTLSYHTMKLYVPLVMAVVAVLFWREIIAIPWRSLLVGVVVGLALAGPMLWMTLRDPAIGSRNEYLSITNVDGFGPRLLLENYWAYCSPAFLFERGDGDATHTMPGYGLELSAIAPLLLIGFAFMAWRLVRPGWLLPDRRLTVLLAAMVLLAPLPGALTQFPAANRSAVLSPLLALVCGLAIVATVFAVDRWLRVLVRPSRRIAIALLLLLWLVPATVEGVRRYDYYFTQYPHDYGVTWGFHHGLIEALRFAAPLADGYDVVWVGDANQPYIFTMWALGVDPATIQDRLVDTNDNPVVYDVDEWGPYRFADNYQSPPDDVPIDDLDVLYQSPHQGNEVFYEVRGGTTDDGERILVVHSPNR